MTAVDSEGEEESTLAEVNQPAEPALDHLSVIQSGQLCRVFQRVSKLLAANPGKSDLVEHVVHLKDNGPDMRIYAHSSPTHKLDTQTHTYTNNTHAHILHTHTESRAHISRTLNRVKQ